MLVHLLYVSRATGTIDDAMVRTIIHSSETNNVENGITGILCSYPEGGIFLQTLEGARAEVNALYNRILVDPRHHDMTLLHYAEIEERRFPGWRMGSVDMKRINLSTILRFSEKSTLDPYSMTGAGAKALLEELTSSAAIVSRDPG